MLHEETKGDAIITTGVGQHQMWAAQYYKFDRPRQWATSGGLGSMGFGLPSALGAAMAFDGTDGGRPKKVCLNCPINMWQPLFRSVLLCAAGQLCLWPAWLYYFFKGN